ncbi:uncharacterized protein LOC132393843 isoform X3 [Hypanus sabinus]|uniref:uncharacterized protein LOC132393843 isoform X3 n=1 Tax=Hypanus sabinus TaxID=79690 RepID=UPI0028C3EC59|nr:uncharacterized protein LOC132393843 isoform X3 [Hypanus sabinus]
MENRCNVQCYGRGEIHEKIVKELDISYCEEPGVPCVLFVYKVSHEIQDIRNALHWVTGGGRVRKEDICAVILLQKSRAVGEEKITTDPGLFHKGTKVFRVFWMDSSSWWSISKTYQCPTVIQTVKQSLIDRTRSRGGSCSGWSEGSQDSETLSVPNEESDSRISSSWSPETNNSSSEKLNCNVQCYGRGDAHEKIVEELDISHCERPGVPCVLFVYRVSNEIQDLQDALHWVTGDGRARKEDICAVILLQKSRDVGEGQIRTYPGLFHEGTAVHRVPWRETSDILKRRKTDFQCPNTIRAIRQSLSDRTRSREHPSPVGQSEDPPGGETLVLSEQSASSISSGWSQRKSSWNSERLQSNGWSEDPKGGEILSMPNLRSDSRISSSYSPEMDDSSLEKLNCNVQCYGQGDVHAEIVKELNINQCEEPRIPCVLFVYKVSRETEDFRNALQWVTGGGRVRKEDICAVILLQKSRDVGEGQIRTYPGIFHEGTAVHRVPWRETSDILKRRKTDFQCPNTIRAIRRSLSDRTRSREHPSPGSSEDPQGSETPSLYSAPTSTCSEQPHHSTSSTFTQEKSEKSSEQLQCNGSNKDSQGSESPSSCSVPTSTCSEQPDHLASSTFMQEKSEKSSEKPQCNGSNKDSQGSESPSSCSVPTSTCSEQPDHLASSTFMQEKSEKSSEKPQCNGSNKDSQGSESPSSCSVPTSTCSEQPDHSTSSTWMQEKSEKSSEELQCNRSSEDSQGSESPSSCSAPTSTCSEQPDHLTSSTFMQEKSEKSSEKPQCNVQCYGPRVVDEKIVKELKICQCEGPGVPCVLFVYKVSHENQDLRDALQWVTGDRTVRKEDICSVILLQKSRDFGVNKMTTDPGLFHEGTNVFQIFWTEASDTWTSTDEGHAVIQSVRQSLVNKTESRGGSCPGV